MAFRGLKTLTATNIAVLLLIAMGLVDFILVIFQQRALIQEQISKGRIFMETLQSQIRDPADDAHFLIAPDRERKLGALMARSGFPCALVMDDGFRSLNLGRSPCPLDVDLEKTTRAAIAAGKETVTPFGVAWAVFWRQDRGIVLSMPLTREDRGLGAGSVVLPLDEVYALLRRSQKVVFIYMLINAALLTGIGLYRISRTYFDPVRRLAQKAESYSEDGAPPFVVRKEDNALGQLSQSLNLMLKRISEDKERLKSTIASLEKANRDLKQAQQEIIRTEKFASVGRLASGVAHEIGNPLGIVGGYLELLRQKDIDDKERDEYVDRSIREVDRINLIIRQLLDFSRSAERNVVVFSVHEAIADIVRILKPQPLMSGIDLELSLSAQKDRILGDPDQLRQVFLNLVLNAADAIASTTEKTSGSIGISTQSPFSDENETKPPEQIRIAISDDGPGIPEENLDAIFDPFFTTKAPGKGTGLGLWVSYLIIEGIGGRIRARSRFGEGTTLEVYLPLYREKTVCKRSEDPVLLSVGQKSGEPS